MPLRPCALCGAHVFDGDARCPSCGAAPSLTRLTAAAALMGLALAACGDKDGGDSVVSDLYGVVDTSYVDDDGDGYAARDGDCDDNNAAVNPGALETTDDGVDSNCDGDDNT